MTGLDNFYRIFSEIVNSRAGTVELDKLVGLFHADSTALGDFSPVAAGEIPEPQRSLLDHDKHMTVTVEKFHSSAVDVVVRQERFDSNSYAREICLVRQSDGRIVQYGIVRLDFNHLAADVQSEIRSRNKPLGRILIEHDVLRRVQLLNLYRVRPSVKLAESLQFVDRETCYGRTAIIFCNNEPAIELLEIVRV